MTKMIPPFHLAFPIKSLESARAFYGDLLGMREGRSGEHWVDFDFYGHQLAMHVRDAIPSDLNTTEVDGKQVPLPHFGVVLDLDSWRDLAERLRAADVEFVIEPYIRFEGQPGEQGTLFFRDPSGNALEIKGFASLEGMFQR